MASPKSRISRSRRGMRRSHDALKGVQIHKCPNCSAIIKPHCVCHSCGYYKGKEVISMTSETNA